MNTQAMETKIKDLLEKKIEKDELQELHLFYEIPNLYNYSHFNRIMIWIQGGTIVAGYNRWKNLGRYVKKGEHSKISILVPYIISEKVEKNGKIEKEERCVGFMDRKVFDISQTDGKPLEYTKNSRDEIKYSYEELKNKFSVKFNIEIGESYIGEARGYYQKGNKIIMINQMSNNTDKCKTLFHELGHHFLHSEDSNSNNTLNAKEVEAELVSLLVSSTLNIKTDKQESYIKAYNTHKPNIRINNVLGAVQRILKVLN